jgi:peroxiredoxin
MAVSIGDEAPNFDLSSTEGVLLMLRDEVIRTTQLLYFFAEAGSDQVQRDLDALNRGLDELAPLTCRVLAVSTLPLDALKTLQAERKLLFPLLHDDRNFSAAYGIAAEEGRQAAPALFLVSRRQRILWHANPAPAAAEALPQVLKLLKSQPSPTASYPKSVINRLVDRWVN